MLAVQQGGWTDLARGSAFAQPRLFRQPLQHSSSYCRHPATTPILPPVVLLRSWDVSALAGRAGQIRIVDASSASPWGHINVDEIVLSWNNRGGLHPQR